MKTNLWIRMFCLPLIMLLTPTAQAASTVADLQALQNDAYRATTQMMMYVIMDHATDRKATAANHLRAGEAEMAKIGDAALGKKWQALQEAVTRDPYSNGEINPLNIYDMENRATELAGDIRGRIAPDLPRHQKILYEMVGTLQAMITIYLRNSADPRGGSGYVGVNSGVDLADLKQRFSSKMDVIVKDYPKLAPSLFSTRAKWDFLSVRFTDYNNQSVPYLVDLYGHQIINDLMGLAAAPK